MMIKNEFITLSIRSISSFSRGQQLSEAVLISHFSYSCSRHLMYLTKVCSSLKAVIIPNK